MAIISNEDLRAFLPQYDFADETAEVSVRLVSGWLQRATGLSPLPDPLPDDLWADALELAGLLISNPESLASRTAGPTSRTWPLAGRRDAILARVASVYRQARSAPSGCFPPPAGWPEPSIRRPVL